MYSKILRCLAPLTGLMILVSAGWTAINVVSLLGTSNPLAWPVAAFFDASWLIAVAVQNELRYRVDWRGRLAAVGWSLAGLAATVNVTSELLGHRSVAVAVIAGLVPPLAKGCLALKLLVESNSAEAKTRFTGLVQSWQDQRTELQIQEAMSASWHKVERVHENQDAQRLAVTQSDRLANLELTSGTEMPVTRTAAPVVWERPPSMPLAPLFVEPAAPAPVPETAVETVPVPRKPFGFAPTVAAPDMTVEQQAAPIVARVSQPVPAPLAERTEANRRRRADAMQFIGDNPDVEAVDVAARFGVSVRTVQRWLQTQD